MPRTIINDGKNKQQRYQAKLKAQGLCITCGKNKTDQSKCKKCLSVSNNIKNYNKYKNLLKRKDEIIVTINNILLESNDKFPLKMQYVYNHVIDKLKLDCSTITIRKYWLESKQNEK
jgi:hypothetical protein